MLMYRTLSVWKFTKKETLAQNNKSSKVALLVKARGGRREAYESCDSSGVAAFTFFCGSSSSSADFSSSTRVEKKPHFLVRRLKSSSQIEFDR